MGYRPISVDDMNYRFKTYNGEINSRKHLDYCRRDTKERLHACLVNWNELDVVSEAYKELAKQAGIEKEHK
jgi:hypothetical protein